MVVRLVDLAAEKAVIDHRTLEGKLQALPKTILFSLLVAACRKDRILTFQTLIHRWPYKEVILRECQGFSESYAVLLAGDLQKNMLEIDVIDIRGCEIGLTGTSAFCRSALEIYQHSEKKTTTKHPASVLLDCQVNSENFALVKQAIIQHSYLDMKVYKLVVQEVGKNKVCSLVSLLEPNIITSLDCQFNSLEQGGLIRLCETLITFVNLRELNLAYNCLKPSHTEAAKKLAIVITHLPQLQRLNLAENKLGNKIVAILESLVSPLSHLNLSGCGIRDAELKGMAKVPKLNHLTNLELSVNALVTCVKSLSKFVCKCAVTLEYLAIEDNMFVSRSVPQLSVMLKKLTALKTLSICYNHLSNDDVDAIRKAVPNVEVVNRDYLF